ncbi:FG-GAP repeat domain-containing protein [Enhygromyxa salina]|uniref:FG-GAP repeat protein n=1 Tax=Enhygromyxa salina TaxID=215803 RepID=A0A2S9YIS5_9BACT|nr:VCBS repeat-containing protein [Enhygromyxa salina]PRQ05017.1 FG-GAP repeat protein [Enhygromyxa salina]
MAARFTAPLFAAHLACAVAFGVAGCTVEGIAILPGLDDGASGEGTSEQGIEGETESGFDGGDTDPEDDGGTSGSPSLDLPDPGDDEFVAQACVVPDSHLDAPLPCEVGPTSVDMHPVVAWKWTGPAGEDSVIVTPLVGNFDDDNADGLVDLCDRPDVLVVAVDLSGGGKNKGDPPPAGHIYLLDSNTGQSKLVFDHPVDATATPALADLDADGIPEILAFERSEEVLGQVGERRVIAFDADGSVRWVSDTWVWSDGGGALAIADLDADGSPEILAPEHVLSADGVLLWAPLDPPPGDSVPIAADLDLDGTLEVLFGRSVYAADGTELFELPLPGNKNLGVAAVANFDDDEYPEIYIQAARHYVIEHDGQAKIDCGPAAGPGKGMPVSILDIDSDGKAEILARHGTWLRASTIVDGQCETLWSVKVNNDSSGAATGFDFLADGTAETVFADLEWVRIYGAQGDAIAQIQRRARPSAANPVIADADNDGAAELILVGSEPIDGYGELEEHASVILVHNADDRFAPTRRIWNQHAYHVTNIREDATVPVEQQPHWQTATSNSFRNNVPPGYTGPLCQSAPSD